MKYLTAKDIDINECQKLKNSIIERLNKEGLHIWDAKYPSDDLIKKDILESNARIVKIDGKIVAYSVFDKVENEFGENVFDFDDLYCFSRLMVGNDFLGKHVATFLIKNMLYEMKYMGARGCGIMVHPFNLIAIKMYEKIGFVFEKQKDYPYGNFSTYHLIFEN